MTIPTQNMKVCAASFWRHITDCITMTCLDDRFELLFIVLEGKSMSQVPSSHRQNPIVNVLASIRNRFMLTTSIESMRIVVTAEDRGIRLSGSPLSRPRQVIESSKRQLERAKQMQRQDELDRIPIEGKFGQGKRRFSLNPIMAKLAETSEAVIIARAASPPHRIGKDR